MVDSCMESPLSQQLVIASAAPWGSFPTVGNHMHGAFVRALFKKGWTSGISSTLNGVQPYIIFICLVVYDVNLAEQRKEGDEGWYTRIPDVLDLWCVL